MKDNIIKISNIFVMIENHISDIGLTNGKMGIVLFLYYSSRVTGCKSYVDLADSLFDEVLEKIKTDTNLSFPNGLAGIAFAINRLIKNKFIDGDMDNIFFNVDKKIYLEVEKRTLNDFSEEFPFFTYGLYLLERHSHKSNRSKASVHVKREINLALNICEEVYNYNFDFNPRSIVHTNSVLYFLINLNKNKEYSKRANLIIELIIAKIIIALNNNSELRNYLDITIGLGKQINNTNPITNVFLSITKQFSEKKKKIFDSDIKEAWQRLLFYPSYKYLFDPKIVDDWINDADLFYDHNRLINNDCKRFIIGGLHLLKSENRVPRIF